MQDVGNELKEPTSVIHKAGKSKRQQLINLLDDCNTELRDLERYLLQYRSLKSAKPRLRDRLRFGIKPISQIRLKLSQHTDGLNLFLTHVNTSSLGRLEQASEASAGVLDDIRVKLDELRHQVETGQKDAAVLDTQSNWYHLEKELVGDGVTKRDVISNRDSIQEYITTWLNTADHVESAVESETKSYKNKRTSSMVPWTPTETTAMAQDTTPQSLTHSKRLACGPSLSGSVTEMWNFLGRNSPSIESELSISEENSTFSESVFSSLSPPSSRSTTPGLPEKSLADTFGGSPNLLGLTTDTSSSGGIDSLMDELDAFVLDISRSSTPDTVYNVERQDTGLSMAESDQSVDEEAHATQPKRRVVTRPLLLTLEEAFTGGVKKKNIRGRLLAERNDQDELELRESGIEVPFPAGARPGLRIELPDVAVGFDGTPQDLHFIVEWVCKSF